MSRYLPLLEALDAWQAAARVAHPGVIPCRRGCSACCLGPFDISVADLATLLDGVDALDPGPRAAILARAREQMDAAAAIEPTWATPYHIGAIGDPRFDAVSDALAALPCPCLGPDGECLVYRHRPMVCRLMGLGLALEPTEDTAGASGPDVIENACPIQDRFPEYAHLPARPFPLDRWERDEETAKADAARHRFGGRVGPEYETTIAGGLVAWVGP